MRALALALLLVGCARPAAEAPVERPATRPAADLPWGGQADEAVAASRDCADLQSWFDAADEQRAAYLRRFGTQDPSYRYAFDVMQQAHDRMQTVGCYD